MKDNHVWEFTNQKKLNKKEFLNYFEKKVFKTIRKYDLLPKNRRIKIKKSNSLKTKILKKVLETKFSVEESNKPNFSDENSSDIAEMIFENLLKGKFTGPKPNEKTNKPLYFHSDKEIETYAKLTNIKGTKPKRNKKIQNLFEKFTSKNQDLDINIIKALEQIKN